MNLEVIFDDGSWFIGHRGLGEKLGESKDCHHFKVLYGSSEFIPHVGKEIAVHLSKPKFFVLRVKL